MEQKIKNVPEEFFLRDFKDLQTRGINNLVEHDTIFFDLDGVHLFQRDSPRQIRCIARFLKRKKIAFRTMNHNSIEDIPSIFKGLGNL